MKVVRKFDSLISDHKQLHLKYLNGTKLPDMLKMYCLFNLNMTLVGQPLPLATEFTFINDIAI